MRRPRTREPPSRRSGNPTNSRPRIPRTSSRRRAGVFLRRETQIRDGLAVGRAREGQPRSRGVVRSVPRDSVGRYPRASPRRPSAPTPRRLATATGTTSRRNVGAGGGGYVWDAFPGADPDTPGPGQYYDAEKGRDGRRSRAVVHHRRREGRRGKSTLSAAAGRSRPRRVRRRRRARRRRRPRVENKGFTFGGKVGVDWASAGPGRDAPAVGKYFRDLDKLGGDVRDSVKGPGGRGPAFSFGTAPARPRDDPTTGPGPGDYHRDGDDDTNANDAKTEKRREDQEQSLRVHVRVRPRTRRRGGVGPGPGAYQPNVFPEDDDPDALRRVPRSRSPRNFAWVARWTSRGTRRASPAPASTTRTGTASAETFAGPPSPSRGKSRVPPERRNARARFPVRDSTPSPRPWGRARAFTMYARVEDPTLRASSGSCGGPGAYGVPVAPGAELSHPTRGAASVRGREAWANTGWGAGAEDLPGPAEYVTSATARPIASAPSFTMGARAETGEKSPGGRGSSAPVPGSTTATGTSPRARRSFVHVRASRLGRWRLGSPRREAAQPGPGQYHDRDARARAAAGPSFTFGVKTEVPSDDRVGPSGYSGVPVPGNITTRIANRPSAGTAPGSRCTSVSRPRGRRRRHGADGPGPAFYVGPWTAKDRPRRGRLPRAGMMTNHDAPGGLMDVVKARDHPRPGILHPRGVSVSEERRGRRDGVRTGGIFVGAQGVHVRLARRVRGYASRPGRGDVPRTRRVLPRRRRARGGARLGARGGSP